jgi:hypothetical protein
MKKYLPGNIFIHDQSLQVRKNISKHFEEKNFDEIFQIISENFQNSKASLLLIQFFKIVYSAYNFLKLDNSNTFQFLGYVKDNIIFNAEFDCIKRIVNFELISKSLIESCGYEKTIALNMIHSMLDKELDNETMFNLVNKTLMMNNYSIFNNELEIIIKQLILSIKGNMKLKNPQIKFLFGHKIFIEKLNKKFFANGIDYSDIQMKKIIKKFLK